MSRFAIQTIMILLGILFFFTGFNINPNGFEGDVLNQRNYVLILAVLLVLASLGNIIYLKLKNKDLPAAEKEEEKEQADESNSNKTVYLMMGLLVFYAVGFTYIGFFVTSLIFIFTLTWFMQQWQTKKIFSSMLFSVVLTVVLFFLFDVINVYLPNTLLI